MVKTTLRVKRCRNGRRCVYPAPRRFGASSSSEERRLEDGLVSAVSILPLLEENSRCSSLEYLLPFSPLLRQLDWKRRASFLPSSMP